MNAEGQILLPLVMVMALLLMLSTQLFDVASHLHKATQQQTDVDAIALSIGRLQARGLTLLAILNQQLVDARKLTNAILRNWALLAACAAACTVGVGCACLPIFNLYNKQAPSMLKDLHQLAKSLYKAQQFILSELKRIMHIKAHRFALRRGLRRLKAVSSFGTNAYELPVTRVALAGSIPGNEDVGDSINQFRFTLPQPLRLETDAIQFSFQLSSFKRKAISHVVVATDSSVHRRGLLLSTDWHAQLATKHKASVALP